METPTMPQAGERPTTALIEVSPETCACASSIGSAALDGLCGYVTALALLTINPLAGAIFGAVAGITSKIFSTQTIEHLGTNPYSVYVAIIGSVFVGIIAGMLATAAFGVAITFEAACILTGTHLGLSLLGMGTLAVGIAHCPDQMQPFMDTLEGMDQAEQPTKGEEADGV